MVRHQIFLAVIFSMSSFSASAAISTEEKALIEELTGKKAAVPARVSNKTNVSSTAAERHLEAGLTAFKSGDFVNALKSYNVVIEQYPKSVQLRAAYLAKAQLYSKMGLADQAQLNVQLAEKEHKQNK